MTETDDILIVEDDYEIRTALLEELAQRGFRVRAEANAERALEALRTGEFSAVLTDVRMPGMSGIDLCQRLASDWPHVPVVVMTAFANVPCAVDALRAGTFDFLPKPFDMDDLEARIRSALGSGGRQGVLRRTARTSPAELFPGIVGTSAEMARLCERLSRIAAGTSTLLVSGEPGVGKEHLARTVHRARHGEDSSFLVADCTRFGANHVEVGHAGERFEAALFGEGERTGWIHRARGGTLFLRDVSSLPSDTLGRLLCTLEARWFVPLGTVEPRPLDTTVIASVSMAPGLRGAAMFARDLSLRLSGVHVDIPPLRARGYDVLLLARAFLASNPGKGQGRELSDECEAALLGYEWPGNVRELRECVHAAKAVASGPMIAAADLPAHLTARAAGEDVTGSTGSLDELERHHIQSVLSAVGGNKARAARQLGIDRATLYRKLDRYGLMEKVPQ